MKKLWFLCLILLAQTTIFAQSDAEDIRAVMTSYVEVVENKDYQKTMDYVYPKLFEFIPRSLMEESLEKQANDPEI